MALTNYSMLGRRVGWAEVPATDRATLSDAWCLGPSSCTDNGNLRLCAPLRLKLPSSDGPAHAHARAPAIYLLHIARPYTYVLLGVPVSVSLATREATRVPHSALKLFRL